MDKKIVRDIKQISTSIQKRLRREKKRHPKRYKQKEKKLSAIRTELRNLRDSI